MKADMKLKKDQEKEKITENTLNSKTTVSPTAKAFVKNTELKSLTKLLFSLEKNDKHDYALDSNQYLLAFESLRHHKQGIKKESIFLGAIAKCAISGCDVHVLNDKLEIEKHYDKQEQIDSSFELARKLIRTLPESAFCILVYNDHLEMLNADGTNELI